MLTRRSRATFFRLKKTLGKHRHGTGGDGSVG